MSENKIKRSVKTKKEMENENYKVSHLLRRLCTAVRKQSNFSDVIVSQKGLEKLKLVKVDRISFKEGQK